MVAPASPPDKPEKIDETLAHLTALGFQIKPGQFLRQRTGYLAGTDTERAADINTLFADREVKAIFALRGGYGSCRLLPLLDYAAIRANPKPFVGFSDITAMHLAILKKAGLVTFHGPDATKAFRAGNDQACRRMLMEPLDPSGTLLFSKKTSDVKTIIPGQLSGPLIGGNMTCLLRLIGTPYEPDFHNAILFLEDTGEKAYRVDGMFTHLRLAGILDQIGGLVLGQFDHSNSEEEARITACLQREAEQIGVPCVSGAPIGHFLDQITLPQGVPATLHATEGTLKLAPLV